MARVNTSRAAIRIAPRLEIPADALDPEGFRQWVHSPSFPECGRIDYLDGSIEVDMSPEKLQTHGTLKTCLVRYISNVVEAADLGQVFVDCTRLVSLEGHLSCEPDIIFVSLEALKDGRVQYRSGSRNAPDDFLEVVGAASLVVEVVSDSSVVKDTRRLPPLYAAAGVTELWIADARGEAVELAVHRLESGSYLRVELDRNGYQESAVLGRRIRLSRKPWHLPGTWRYLVDESL